MTLTFNLFHDLGLFKVKFSNCHFSGMGGSSDLEQKEQESDMMLDPLGNPCLVIWASQ